MYWGIHSMTDDLVPEWKGEISRYIEMFAPPSFQLFFCPHTTTIVSLHSFIQCGSVSPSRSLFQLPLVN